MNIHIPKLVISRAISYAQMDHTKESIGFFVVNPGKIDVAGGGLKAPYVEYKSMVNISKHPDKESEVSAEEMAGLIIDQGLQPIAVFHSHPSGEGMPSQGDSEYFPSMYVDWGFIWTQADPNLLTQYKPGAHKFVSLSQVFIDVHP